MLVHKLFFIMLLICGIMEGLFKAGFLGSVADSFFDLFSGEIVYASFWAYLR